MLDSDTHSCMSRIAQNGEEIGDPCMARCFLCQMCHLTLTENSNTWQKWLKLDLVEASLLLININVHPATVKERGGQLDSWDTNA